MGGPASEPARKEHGPWFGLKRLSIINSLGRVYLRFAYTFVFLPPSATGSEPIKVNLSRHSILAGTSLSNPRALPSVEDTGATVEIATDRERSRESRFSRFSARSIDPSTLPPPIWPPIGPRAAAEFSRKLGESTGEREIKRKGQRKGWFLTVGCFLSRFPCDFAIGSSSRFLSLFLLVLLACAPSPSSPSATRRKGTVPVGD